METKDIQKLIDFISQSGLDEVNIETSELKLAIKRYSNAVPVAVQTQPSFIAPAPAMATPTAPQVAAAPIIAAPVAEASNLITIKSPMIGTFYRSTGPDKPNFADIGSDIEIGKVVCIIEAMKLFNEIESEISGKIVKILVENATPVEFDQPLFLVEPV
ncbi:acetyl-CoA carboxylase biotin carboxyl carrier protein [Emticicia sp.]|uniref:acetyl-CoA carboxylase biotin carboxyl carrier protein n=1 Tax=Emticicia sp. TaxID=1930953 RepID=UPI003752EF2D